MSVVMLIAAVVVTLDAHADLCAHALRRMADDSRVALGECRSAVVPAVLETSTGDEGEALVNDLLTIPGVLRVDVVSADFSSDEDG